jgi:hypothetical protein
MLRPIDYKIFQRLAHSSPLFSVSSAPSVLNSFA